MPHTEPSAAGAPIQPLPTSVTGFVGAAGAGPFDTPVTVTSAGHFHATFGPSLDADRPLGHAVDLFFANGGTSDVVVRAAGPAPGQLVPVQGPGGVHALDGTGVTVLVVAGLTAAHSEQVRVALGRCAAYRAVLVLDLPTGPWGPAHEAALGEVTEHAGRAADPSARYVNVRRLTDHVLGSVTAGLGFVADERGDAALWARVRQLTEDFLDRLWRQGALQGVKPEQAYGVRCGPGETMTEADVVEGRVVVRLWFAAVRPAEFDVHTVTLQAVGAAGEGVSPTEPAPPVAPSVVVPSVVEEPAAVRRVDLRRVVSRYIGETEKNLSRLLDRAQETGEVLLFDEADALFGKRTRVRDAHDRFANQEVSRLVERMARERGVEVRWQRGKARRRWLRRRW